jgi:hypothetical protein
MALAEPGVNVHCGSFMSIYTEILHRACEKRPGTVGPPLVSEAVKELLYRRSRLISAPSIRRPTNWAAGALANQVAYDVALIELARSVGIVCDPASFELPELRRNEVNRELAARGVHVGDPQLQCWG